MDPQIEEEVRRRAHARCEYCGHKFSAERGEVEHIWPRRLGGSDTLANLALACSRCNANKGTRVVAADPVTGIVVPLFHPRRDAWHEHFLRVGGENEAVGCSRIGRATAALLFHHTPAFFPAETRWQWLEPIENEVLRGDLGRMRVLRLTNAFDRLSRELHAFRFPRELDRRQRRHAAFVQYLLDAEICLTRARISDLDRGLRLATETLHHYGHVPAYRAQIESNRSVLLQQLGAALQLAGASHKARRARIDSVIAFGSGGDREGMDRRHERLRLLSRRAAVEPEEVRVMQDDFRYALEASAEGIHRPLLSIADVLLANRAGSPVDLDDVAGALSGVLRTVGYGQDVDHARAVVVRRRWWAMEAARGMRLDHDLLARDVRLWKDLELWNELRELTVMLGTAEPEAARIVAQGLRRR